MLVSSFGLVSTVKHPFGITINRWCGVAGRQDEGEGGSGGSNSIRKLENTFFYFFLLFHKKVLKVRKSKYFPVFLMRCGG